MNGISRVARHLRLTAHSFERAPSPSFLILFINSICNMKCEHCFYWQSLNSRDDLTKDEIFQLSQELGHIENLNLSGGEPFLRREFAEICRQFIKVNKVRQIYVPTNGWYTDRTVAQISSVLEEPDLDLFVVELSLDGLAAFHDEFRVAPGAFDRAMRTYDALAELQERDPRLRIHSVSTATATNLDEIRRLTTYLFDRCPKMDHHNLALLRGERKNPLLGGPDLGAYTELYTYIRRLWVSRETDRYGSLVEPMLQWAKQRTVTAKTQVVPCQAGKLSAVVYSNGDVSVCEMHTPLGNLRERSFKEIWWSDQADARRGSIAAKECYCTNEVFLWPSIVYRPRRLVQASVGARVWRQVEPLRADERVEMVVAGAPMPAATPVALGRRRDPDRGRG